MKDPFVGDERSGAHENSRSKVSKFVAVQETAAAETMPSMVEEMDCSKKALVPCR